MAVDLDLDVRTREQRIGHRIEQRLRVDGQVGLVELEVHATQHEGVADLAAFEADRLARDRRLARRRSRRLGRRFSRSGLFDRDDLRGLDRRRRARRAAAQRNVEADVEHRFLEVLAAADRRRAELLAAVRIVAVQGFDAQRRARRERAEGLVVQLEAVAEAGVEQRRRVVRDRARHVLGLATLHGEARVEAAEQRRGRQRIDVGGSAGAVQARVLVAALALVVGEGAEHFEIEGVGHALADGDAAAEAVAGAAVVVLERVGTHRRHVKAVIRLIGNCIGCRDARTNREHQHSRWADPEFIHHAPLKPLLSCVWSRPTVARHARTWREPGSASFLTRARRRLQPSRNR